jgi:hypothetical protein
MIAVFRSAQFKPYLPDECQVNPNVLGFELADWLSRRLAAAGIVTSYPSFEDWGWYLEYADGDDAYLVCCSGGADDADYEWRVFVDRPRKWFRQQPISAKQRELFDAIVRILQAQGMTVTVENP